jgi:predicted extracellular nuclease/methionine-rich copper-binding protein CopC
VVLLVIIALVPAPLTAQQILLSGPTVIANVPSDGATLVAPGTSLSITFSEAVSLDTSAVSVSCSLSQTVALIPGGGPITFTFQPNAPLKSGDQCQTTVSAAGVTSLNNPTARMLTDYYWTFTVGEPGAAELVINEINVVPTTDQFFELYDGGRGHTSLNGLQLAIYHGATDTLITAAVLDGYATDAQGYFLISTDRATADIWMAPEALPEVGAVTLYEAPAGALEIGSAPVLDNLVEAVVYGSGPPRVALLSLLQAGEPQIDENGRGQAATDSSQRCPNGSGGPRRTASFRPSPPTPGSANRCIADAAPAVTSMTPPADAVVDPQALSLQVTFSEPVALDAGALALACDKSGSVGLTASGGPTTFLATPTLLLGYGESCMGTVFGHKVRDLDNDDPPDHMTASVTWSFGTSRRVATNILINELDSDTPGQDTAEFIELYDGGSGHTDLSGLVLVLFNGATDKAYRTISLDGYQTDSQGYFVIANKAISNAGLTLPNAALQNGPDAVALYVGQASDFPIDAPITTTGLVDALVYGRADAPDTGLLALLPAGQKQVDENGRGLSEAHSNQRCPNGTGGQRQTVAFRPNNPTPGAPSVCTADDAPRVTGTTPAAGATAVPFGTTITVTFSEPVGLSKNWLTLSCSRSGAHTTTASGGPTTWTVTLDTPLASEETCTATIVAARVSDSDSDDPPDTMAANFVWSFTTTTVTIADFVLINELDANTPGTDTAEFVELYDGGRGRTALDGLTLVLFNGNGAVSYAAVPLDGYATGPDGYFVIGNSAVSGGLTIANGLIQNGPDALALYAAPAHAFPTNTPVTTTGLVDAIVYGAEPSDTLRALLTSGQTAVDEGSLGAADSHSLQRCPDGSGGARVTATIRPGTPTPGASNRCLSDTAPHVVTTVPADQATAVLLDAAIAITFSEPVTLLATGISLECEHSGEHAFTLSGGPERFTLTPKTPFTSSEWCQVTLPASSVSDSDTLDPPDAMATDRVWRFQTELSTPAPADGVLINEFDVDTPGADRAEFIELFDGGRGNLSLDGLIVVLFNGQDDAGYRTINLSGARTDGAGYLLIGGPELSGRDIDLPAGAIQNGADAIALYAAAPGRFPNGTAIALDGLEDAVVYGTDDPADVGLMALLLGGQPQIDESSRGDPTADANQRCPNGAGAARTTTGFLQGPPTPGSPNACTLDESPSVVSTLPVGGAAGVSATPQIAVTFSEPVAVDSDWLRLACQTSGSHTMKPVGGPLTYTATPAEPLVPGELCEGTVVAARVHDSDTADPPDMMAADVGWTFTVAPATCAAPTVPIATVQGIGAISPMLGQNVTVDGVITADFRNTMGGLFIQTPDQSASGPSGASEGLFVTFAEDPGPLAIGDRLTLSGKVTETDQRTTLAAAALVAVCGHDVAITPLSWYVPPGTPEAWEAVESMLVALGPLTITANDTFVTTGELQVMSGPRPIYPTEITPPGAAAYAAWQANVERQFTLDDGQIGGPPPAPQPADLIAFRAGSTIPAAHGIVDGYGTARRVHLVEPPSILTTNPRPTPIETIPGALRLVNVNLDVFDNGDAQGNFANPAGAQSAAEVARQRAKVVALLRTLDADIIVLNGLEPDGADPGSATADLLHELNAALASPYEALTWPTPEPDNSFAAQSVLLYRPAKVVATISQLPLPATSGHLARPLLVLLQDRVTQEQFEILVLHLVPRDDCPASGPDSDQHDGQACGTESRTQAAEGLATWLAGRGAAQTIVVGTLNAYGREEPLRVLTDGGLIDLVTSNTKPPFNDYTQIDGGQTASGQRALAGSGIAGHVRQAAVWHVNADESPGYDFRQGNPPHLYAPDPVRSATTDPLIIDLILGKLRAGFTTAPTVLIGHTSHFSNTTTGAGPLHFLWDFGDGSAPATTAAPDHTYQRIGTYTITLTVSNAADSDIFQATVHVLPRRAYLPTTVSSRP